MSYLNVTKTWGSCGAYNASLIFRMIFFSYDNLKISFTYENTNRRKYYYKKFPESSLKILDPGYTVEMF